MGTQVIVGAVRDPFELAPAERELVLHIRGGLRVVGELVGLVRSQAQLLLRDAEVQVPLQALLDPGVEPLVVGAGFDEELHLHLLELARAEDEVARRDLVAERLADLGDPERQLLARRGLDQGEVHEHALRGLGTEVGDGVVVLDRAEERPQHQVELLGLGELGAAAVRARHHAVGVRLQVVLTEALMAVRALDQWVVERLEVAAGFPHLGRGDDGGFDADDVVAELHRLAPPRVADVATELDPERAVVPGRTQSPVDLGGLERDPSSFREGGDGLHEVGGHDARTPLPAAGSDRWRGPIVPAGMLGGGSPPKRHDPREREGRIPDLG